MKDRDFARLCVRRQCARLGLVAVGSRWTDWYVTYDKMVDILDIFTILSALSVHRYLSRSPAS